MSAPMLVALGGPPGSGKSTVARHLSRELGWPVLGSDLIGGAIKVSAGLRDSASDPFWIAYDVVFSLTGDFLSAGVSVILDLNFGWAFQWHQLDLLKERYPAMICLPLVLRCPYERCLARIAARHRAVPARSAAPTWYIADPAAQGVWTFLDQLDRPDVTFIDAAGPAETTYASVARHIGLRRVGESPLSQPNVVEAECDGVK